MTGTVTGLTIHPVKSCRGLAVDTITVTPRGPAGDRRWLIIDEKSRFVTAREFPRLVLIEARETNGVLELRAPGQAPLRVPRPDAAAPTCPLRIWKDDTTGGDAGEAPARWLGDFLERTVRLVYQRPSDVRSIAAYTGAAAGDEVSFADGYPLLLIGSASLDALNERLERPVTMTHFRPNVVVATSEPFVEDRWSRLTIGTVPFVAARRCARCVLTTVDPLTGERDPAQEPLKTLRSFRFDREARGIFFGVNLIPRGIGDLETGMALEAREA